MSKKQQCAVCQKLVPVDQLSSHTVRCSKKLKEENKWPYPFQLGSDILSWIASTLYNLAWGAGSCFGGMCFTSATSVMAQCLLFLMVVWQFANSSYGTKFEEWLTPFSLVPDGIPVPTWQVPAKWAIDILKAFKPGGGFNKHGLVTNLLQFTFKIFLLTLELSWACAIGWIFDKAN